MPPFAPKTSIPHGTAPEPVAPIVITRRTLCRILATVGARPAETGGILLGPVGSEMVTDFFYDATASCTGVTYTPDHVALARKLKEEWLPHGVDFKGFVHSHPGRLARLSDGDLRYIARLLKANDDMDRFLAPIVLPHRFHIRPIVVPRDRPDRPVVTTLHIL